MKKIIIVTASVFATIISAFVLFITWEVFLSPYSLYKTSRAYDLYAKALQDELQFTHGSPYYKIGNETAEVFTIHPKSDLSPVAKAGVVSGDIVFDDFTITEFYILLERFRGKVFRFRVVSGGDGPELRERPQKIIEIYVPKRK